jgi:hypothetical protein
LQGPEKLDYETPLWTCARVAHLIEKEFGVEYQRGHVWKILDDLGWSCQRERKEEEIRRWRRVRWPAINKSLKRRAHDPFIERKRNKPAAAARQDVVAALRGSRFLQYNFNWDTISAVIGIIFYSFYCRLHKGSVKSTEVVDLLQALLRHIQGLLLIVWDRLSAHRSKFTRNFIAGQDERLWVEHLCPSMRWN